LSSSDLQLHASFGPDGNRVYDSKTYIYIFPADDLTVTIQNHAKRMYAPAMKIRGGWIGQVTLKMSIRNNMRPTNHLNEK